jgi:hypothetical protein
MLDNRTDEDRQFIHDLAEQCHKALVIEQVQSALGNLEVIWWNAQINLSALGL